MYSLGTWTLSRFFSQLCPLMGSCEDSNEPKGSIVVTILYHMQIIYLIMTISTSFCKDLWKVINTITIKGR
jgi:hypothetical protein